MIKKFLVFFLIATPAFADVFQFPVKQEKISEIQKIIPQPLLMRGEFEQIKTLKGTSKKFISSGNFIFSKENGLYWNLKKPFSSTIIFTKKGLIKIEDGKKEIMAASTKPFFEEFSEIFQSVFSGDTSKIQDSFDLFFMQKNQGWILGLRAKSDVVKSIITEITIKGDKNAREILLKEQYGDYTNIKLKNVSQNQKPLNKDEESYFKI